MRLPALFAGMPGLLIAVLQNDVGYSAFLINNPGAYYRRELSIHMSYFQDRLRAIPVALLVLAIYAALPTSFTHRWGDATFVSLMFLSGVILYWPETYFCRGIAGGRKKRNLAVNWAVLLVSTGVAAAYAQHESGTPWGAFYGTRRDHLGMILVMLVFAATYAAIWLACTRLVRYGRIARRSRRTPNPALR